MTLCLDTATLIDLIRGRPSTVRDRYRQAIRAGEAFAVPVVVIHELVSGVVTSRDAMLARERMDETLVELPIIDLEAKDVEVTGGVAGDLRRRGRSIGDIDTLIAGQALARGWTMVTSNVKHFGRVGGLPLIDWREGSERLTAERIAARVAEID